MLPEEEKRIFQESAARYLERSYSFEQRMVAMAQPRGYSLERWREMAELGWLAIGLPEAQGGLGDASVQLTLAQEMGRALVVEPWLSTTALCAPLLARLGNDEQRAQLADIAQGNLLVAFAGWERQGRYDAFDVRSPARLLDSGWRLDGGKTLVLDGGAADVLLVLMRTSGAQRDRTGLTLFLVPADTPGVQVAPLPTYDGRQTAHVELHNVMLGPECVVGEPGAAWPAVEQAIDHATVMACGFAVGAMEYALKMTRQWLGERRQFGRLITDNQVIRHRLVDMLILIEQSRAISEAAAHSLEAEPVKRKRAVSLAKAFVSSAGRKVGEESVQLHGAIGMTDEYAVGHYYKSLAANANLFGDEAWHYERLGEVDCGPAEL